MTLEFWATIGVGVALAGLQWRLYSSLNACMDGMEARLDRIETELTSVKERLSRIEGWIADASGKNP